MVVWSKTTIELWDNTLELQVKLNWAWLVPGRQGLQSQGNGQFMHPFDHNNGMALRNGLMHERTNEEMSGRTNE